MNTNINDEKTQFNGTDSEKTIYEESASNNNEDTVFVNDSQKNTGKTCDESNKDSKASSEKNNKGGFHVGEAAAGAAAGILVGGLGTLFMSNAAPDSEPVVKPENNDAVEWTEDVNVSDAVNDDMSFSEAFAAARQDVGAGGAFEWHGSVYSTYTQDEWNNMTPEERQEYGERFDWTKFDSENSDVVTNAGQNSTTQQNVESDDVEVVSVDHNTTNNNVAGNGGQNANDDDIEIVHSEEPEVLTQDVTHSENVTEVDGSDVEILGVTHDDASGANIGMVNVDGQNVAFIDVDNDQVFDYAATDVNSDGNLQDNEIIDLSGQNITMSDFEAKGSDGMMENDITACDGDVNLVQDAGI